jgi:hypothetical protein
MASNKGSFRLTASFITEATAARGFIIPIYRFGRRLQSEFMGIRYLMSGFIGVAT